MALWFSHMTILTCHAYPCKKFLYVFSILCVNLSFTFAQKVCTKVCTKHFPIEKYLPLCIIVRVTANSEKHEVLR